MRNLSIEQVASDTRISARFIQALEDEQFDELPAPVYVRGFLRSYANYLKIDPQPLLDDLSRYEESDGYVVKGPAPWRGPGMANRPSARSASNDPFRPRPPAAAPTEQPAAERLAPLPAAFPGVNGAADEHPEWEPEIDDGGEDQVYATGDGFDEFEEYGYGEPSPYGAHDRERSTQGVLLERPVPLRGTGGPPRAGIVLAGIALFGAAAAGAFFLFRGDDDGGVVAGPGDGNETPVVQQTPGGFVEVRTQTPTPPVAAGATPEGSPTSTAEASVTPADNAGNEPANEDTPAAAATNTPAPASQPTQAPAATPTSVPTAAVVPTATSAPPTATPTLEPPTATPTPAIVHPLGTSLCGSGVNPCGDPPYLVICGPNGWFIDPTGSYAGSGWPTSSASRIGEAGNSC
jgi:cytoskeleton protein RodZ